MSRLPPPQDPTAVAAQAADWYSRRDVGFRFNEAAAFQAWLNEHPGHAEAFADVESSAQTLGGLRRFGRENPVLQEIEARAAQRKRQRRRGWMATCTALVTLAAILIPQLHRQSSAPTTAPGSIIVKPERRALSDGSWVDLNASAEIADEYSASERRVRLVRGTAFFSVIKDSHRPFTVAVGSVIVRALGTEFTVAVTPNDVDVLVTGGKVAVERLASTLPTSVPVEVEKTILAAGERVLVPTVASHIPLQVVAPPPQAIESAQAWRTLRVEFVNVALADIVERYNRQNRVQMAVDGETAASFRVSCVFWLNDPEGFTRLLETSTGLLVDRSNSSRFVIRPPKDAER